MSPRWAAFVLLLTLLIVGVARIWSSLSRLFSERKEVDDFIQVFNRYHQSQGQDLDAYGRLIETSYRVQELIGHVGVMAEFRAPFGAFVARNYQIILNALPSMNRDLGHGTGGRSEYGVLVAETLVRYMGWSEDLIREKQRDAKNPLVWLREGVSAILLVPVQLLQAFGIGSRFRTASVARSTGFRVAAALVTLVGFVGSIFTIALGWRPMIELPRRIFRF
jgi:hypothetical protein